MYKNVSEYAISNACNQDDINYLWEGIYHYNRTIGPMSNYAVYEPYRQVIRDEKNVIIAGILTKMQLNSMYVELLWIKESYRKMGLGTKLLVEAEQTAIRNGCTFIHLETFSFQAIDFYKKHSYEVFAVFNYSPESIKKYYLRKNLVN